MRIDNGVASHVMISEGGTALKLKIIEIGDWNMNTTRNITKAHGLTLADIRTIKVFIRQDVNGNVYDFAAAGNSQTATANKYVYADSTNVYVYRSTDGFFDSSNFDNASFNRGWIFVWHV